MRHVSMVVLLFAAVALASTGCAHFRNRAEEAEARIAGTERTAQVAEQAAALNAARIIDLEDRVEALEQQLEDLSQEAQVEGS
jgi:TolA-binding protein